MPHVSLSKLADLTGFAWRTVKAKLEAAAVQPVSQDGRSHLYESRPALAALYARPAAADVDLDPQQERARKDKEYADKLSMENAVRRQELLPVSQVAADWSAIILNARARLLRLPSDISCASPDPAQRPAIHDLARAAVYQALEELAAYDPEGGK